MIVAVSQVLMYLAYIIPLRHESELILNGNLWWLFVLDTVLIAAAGYIVNDIFDQESDSFNKPNKQFIREGGLQVSVAWKYYISIVLIGFMIASFIAFQIDKIHLLLIYPFATFLLYLYSSSFKKKPLIGNLVVAIFCAFVPGIILYAEWSFISAIKLSFISSYDFVVSFFIAYIVFAFLSTMIREIIKDIEDIEGDKEVGYKTLPIVTSMDFAKGTSLFFGVLLLASYSLWVMPFYGSMVALLLLPVAGFMAIFTFVILYLIYRAKEKAHFTDISKWLKILMIVSLFIFLCIPFGIDLITQVN